MSTPFYYSYEKENLTVIILLSYDKIYRRHSNGILADEQNKIVEIK